MDIVRNYDCGECWDDKLGNIRVLFDDHGQNFKVCKSCLKQAIKLIEEAEDED